MEHYTEYLKLTEAARRLGVSEKTVRRYVKAGDLPAVFIGNAYRIRPEDLESFVERSRVEVAAGKVEASDLDRLPPAARRTLRRLLRAKAEPAIYWDVSDILGIREEFARIGVSNDAFADWFEQATVEDLQAEPPAPEIRGESVESTVRKLAKMG